MDVLHRPGDGPSGPADAGRRSVLLGMAVALFAASCAERDGRAMRAEADPLPDPAFLALSQSLTGHDDLDPLTAARLSAAFAAIAPDVHARFAELGRLRTADPSSLLAAAACDPLKAAALAIVAAWYTGSLGSGRRSTTVAYRDALMQRPVADAMLPPTYALGGPAWWTAPPPAVGLARSAAAASPPTSVRAPEPK